MSPPPSDPPDSDAARLEALVHAAHEAREEGLVVSTSGNISTRLDGGRCAISAARTRLGRLRRDELVVLDLSSTSPPASGEPRPSRETPMHRAVYRRQRRVDSVLHFQSLAATILACRDEPFPDLNFIPEFPVYIRRVAEVPYLPPGSEDLAEAVAAAYDDGETTVVQLRNHGQLAVGESPAQAVERAVFLELACRMFLLSEPRSSLRRYTRDELDLLRSY